MIKEMLLKWKWHAMLSIISRQEFLYDQIWLFAAYAFTQHVLHHTFRILKTDNAVSRATSRL